MNTGGAAGVCDLDSDGLHEIVIPVLSGDPASLVFRVLEGNGQPAAGDGAEALAPTGGGWRTVSWPAVGGRPDSGELHVGLFGLGGDGQLGADAVWELGKARLDMAGQATSQTVPGLRVHATSAQGELNLTSLLISPPLAWEPPRWLGYRPGFARPHLVVRGAVRPHVVPRFVHGLVCRHRR